MKLASSNRSISSATGVKCHIISNKRFATVYLFFLLLLTSCPAAAEDTMTLHQQDSVAADSTCTDNHCTTATDKELTTVYRRWLTTQGNDLTTLVGRDSLTKDKREFTENKIDKLTSSKIYQMTYAAVSLITLGFVAKNKDNHFRKLRNDYMKYYRVDYDNYTQYLPALAMAGMKAAGVESRSSWNRMLTSDAFSVAIMAGVVNVLKRTSNVTRPDGSDNHSFPSGHTATAFMTATMFSKEYGERYPWLSVGSYSVATATGLLRIANNKHWLSDVLTGAGIGILSTELGYFIADCIFKDKGLNINNKFDDAIDKYRKPSFIGIYMGACIPRSDYDVNDELKIKTSACSACGVEGAYFFNPYVGVGGRLTISDISLYSKDNIIENESFRFSTLSGGAYFSYPLATRVSVGSKLLVGYTEYKKFKINDITIPYEGGASFGTGLSFGFQARRRLCFKIFGDYNIIPPHGDDTKEYMHNVTAGAMIALTF